MTSSLIDLDELVLKCRDENAKAYISEAVISYRGGAFRAAIVGAWIAVCFDIIDKIKELALAGDKQAELYAAQIEKNRKDGDIISALKFEREILETARNKFELISYIEFTDLERLQKDRNRCAHPSLVSEEKIFKPSAELARLHIYSAVTHLLQHPPVQGKFALDRLLTEVDSEYFPDNLDQAIVALSSGPLKKPRDSLVRNFALVLLKRLLKEDLAWKPYNRLIAALKATRELHPLWTESLFREKISSLMRSLQDNELSKIVNILSKIADIWQYFASDIRQRIENFTANLPTESLDKLEFLLEFQPLKAFAEERVKTITKKEVTDALFFELPRAIGDEMITRYLKSRSYDEANSWAQYLKPVARDFNQMQIIRIIVGVSKNHQILGSFEIDSLITALRQTKKISEEAFISLLNKNGLDKYNPSTDEAE